MRKLEREIASPLDLVEFLEHCSSSQLFCKEKSLPYVLLILPLPDPYPDDSFVSKGFSYQVKPGLTPKGENRTAKWASAIFKFVALAFVFLTPATYAIQLQLLGGVIIAQLFPSLFLSLYSTRFRKEGLIVGLLAGVISGVLMAIEANNFGPLKTSLFSTPFGSLYIAAIALALNLLLSTIISLALPKRKVYLQETTPRPSAGADVNLEIPASNSQTS